MPSRPPGRLPETPADMLGPTIRETVLIEGRAFVVTRPDAVERLIDHPELGGKSAADEYQPYWSALWPAARMLASAVLREPWPTPTNAPITALEVGCGLGLPGIAALARGLRVIFSDYDATALHFAADNARANGFTDFSLLHMDWRWPPRDLQVSVLLASDVLYEASMTDTLASLISALLLPDGVCLMTDCQRVAEECLQNTLRFRQLTFTTEPVDATDAAGQRTLGTLYRLRRVSI